jgi:hypothetical protein
MATRIDPQAKQERCLELARGRHLTGTARLANDRGEMRDYEVPSYDRLDVHNVRYSVARGLAYCDCKAGMSGLPCGHAGAVLHAETQRAQALSAAGVAENEGYHAMCRRYHW